MRKFILILTVVALLLSFVACSSGNKSATDNAKESGIPKESFDSNESNQIVSDTNETSTESNSSDVAEKEGNSPNKIDDGWFTVNEYGFETKQFGVGIKFKKGWKVESNEFFPVIIFENSEDKIPCIQIRRYDNGSKLMALCSSWEDIKLGGVDYKYYLEDSTVSLVNYDEKTDSCIRIDIEEYIFIDLKSNNFYYVGKE